MELALYILLCLASIIIIVAVLMQESKSAGLSGSIGGGAEQLFGKKRARKMDVLLTRVTTVATIIFIVVSIVLCKIGTN